MASTYNFETAQFGIDNETLYLLRNRTKYDSMPLTSISSITIRKGKMFRYWQVLLIAGLVVAGIGIYDILKELGILSPDNTRLFDINRFMFPAIEAFGGIVFIIYSLRNTQVMIMTTNEKKYYFSLHELIRKKEYNSFCKFLQKANPAWKTGEM